MSDAEAPGYIDTPRGRFCRGWFGEPMPPGLARGEHHGRYVWEGAGRECAIEMLLVFGAEGRAGVAEGARETPTQRDFYLGRFPVTVQEFECFLASSGYRTTTATRGGPAWQGLRWNGGPRAPATDLSWFDAEAFCAWAGLRLPTDAEWVFAARGHDQRVWPWGDEAPDETRVAWSAKRYPPAVGGRPAGASPFGIEDMVGVVAQWTSGVDTSSPNPLMGGTPTERGRRRMSRGGSFANRAPAHAMIDRPVSGLLPHFAAFNYGMRVALDALDAAGGSPATSPDLQERQARWDGREQGLLEGHQQGHREGIEQGRLQMLGEQLGHRLGHSLTDVERKLLEERVRCDGSSRPAQMVLDASREALVAWLVGADPPAG